VSVRRLLVLVVLLVVIVPASSATASFPGDGAPQVQIASPTDGGFYFVGQNAAVAYFCTSETSFVVACVGSQPNFTYLDTSTPGVHQLSVTATDFAGLQTTATVAYTVLDFTRPTIALGAPADGAAYELGANVTVDFSCDDGAGGSGIQYCAGTLPNGSPLDTSKLGTFRFDVTAVDGANNLQAIMATYRVVDLTPPSIAISTPSDGATYALGDRVAVRYTCADAGSGLHSCVGSQQKGALLDTSHLGAFTFTVSAADLSGNTATSSTTYRIVSPPSIAITTPANGATFVQDAIVAADYSCVNHEDGPAPSTCIGDVPRGARVDTSVVGTQTFTVSATDGSQNASTVTSVYRVIYAFSGFYQPVAALPAINSVKAGDGLPLKFSLSGYRGTDLFVPGSPAWTPCDSPAAGPTAAAGSLSYNKSGDRYTFLATTDKSWAGTCADLTLTLRDEPVHQARFTFRK
jgi:hypothetical protein